MAAVFCWLLCCPKCNETTSHQWLHLLTHLPAHSNPHSFLLGLRMQRAWSLWSRAWNPLSGLFSNGLSYQKGMLLWQTLLGLRAPVESVQQPGLLSRNPGDENLLDFFKQWQKAAWCRSSTQLTPLVYLRRTVGWSKEWSLYLEKM